MIEAHHVRADVVDLRRPGALIPARIALDANVLFWLFYRNFQQASYASGRTLRPARANDYDRFLTRVENAGGTLHVSTASLGEFAETAEYCEWEAIWKSDPSLPQPDPRNPVAEFSARLCKFARYHYFGHRAAVRRDVQGMIADILLVASLLPAFPTEQDLHDHALADWIASCGDFPDATLVAVARHAGIAHVLSDDRDFATFDGLTLFTANHHTIDAARIAGKLR